MTEEDWLEDGEDFDDNPIGDIDDDDWLDDVDENHSSSSPHFLGKKLR